MSIFKDLRETGYGTEHITISGYTIYLNRYSEQWNCLCGRASGHDYEP